LGSSSVRDFFKQHLYNVTLFDFHGDSRISSNETGDLVTRFMCNLPGSNTLCSKLKHKANPPVARQSMKVYAQCDRIAMSAYKRGLLPNGLGRLRVTQAIQNRLEKKGWKLRDLPRECLDEGRKRNIFSASKDEGKAAWMGDFDDALFLEKFEAYKEEFCAVNLDRLLQGKDWLEFFSNGLSHIL